MDSQLITIVLFALGAAVFLLVIYGVMKSPEKEAKDQDKESLDREMREFFQRENQKNKDLVD